MGFLDRMQCLNFNLPPLHLNSRTPLCVRPPVLLRSAPRLQHWSQVQKSVQRGKVHVVVNHPEDLGERGRVGEKQQRRGACQHGGVAWNGW